MIPGIIAASGGGAGVPAATTDQYWHDTILMLGADTALVDESVAEQTFTPVSTPLRDTGVFKFGAASAAFNEAGAGTDALDVDGTLAANQFDFGTDDFTIETWAYIDNIDGTWFHSILGNFNGADTGSWSLFHQNGATPKLTFVVDGSSSTTGTTTLVTGTWYHLAIAREGDDLRLFVGGSLEATTTGWLATSIGGTGTIKIGGNQSGSNDQFRGRLDEVRITRGVARYTASFTAPTAKFARKDTVLDYAVTVPSANVASDLTDFPLMVDLSDMPTGFWEEVQSDGGNIRAYEATGTTLIPHDITYINSVTKIGRMFAKESLSSSSDTTVIIRLLDVASSKLATGDTNGRDAVWSDYRAVFVFPETAERTGSALTTDFSGMETHSEWNKIDYQVLTGAPHQGIETDGTNVWSVDTNALRRMNMALSVLTTDADVAATVLAGGGITINHIGDCTVIGTRLFLTGTNPRSGGGNYHRYLIEFNATTLAYVTHSEIGDDTGLNNNHEFGATVCYDGTNLILFSYSDGSKFRRYSLAMAYVNEVTLSADQGTGIQGSVVLPDGTVYITDDLSGDIITELQQDGTVGDIVFTDYHGGGNVEGLGYDTLTDELYLQLGNGALVYLERENGRDDWGRLHFDRAEVIFPNPQETVWSSAASVFWTVGSGDTQQQFLDVISTGGNGSGFLYDDGPDVLGHWDASNSWNSSTINPAGYDRFRIGHCYNGTTERRVTVDGAFWKDAVITAMPNGGTDTRLKLGATNGEEYMQYVWYRSEYMSDDWMAADYDNMESPSTFYSIKPE